MLNLGCILISNLVTNLVVANLFAHSYDSTLFDRAIYTLKVVLYEIYAYIHAYIHTYINACTYIHTYIHTYVCTYICMYICMYVFMYICMYVCMYVHVCVYVCDAIIVTDFYVPTNYSYVQYVYKIMLSFLSAYSCSSEEFTQV